MLLSVPKEVVTVDVLGGVLEHGLKEFESQERLNALTRSMTSVDQKDNQDGRFLHFTPFLLFPVVFEGPKGLEILFRTYRNADKKICIHHPTDIEVQEGQEEMSVFDQAERALFRHFEKFVTKIADKNADMFSFLFFERLLVDHSSDYGRKRLGIPFIFTSRAVTIIDCPDTKQDMGYMSVRLLLTEHSADLDT